jgi:hypothetical protein
MRLRILVTHGGFLPFVETLVGSHCRQSNFRRTVGVARLVSRERIRRCPRMELSGPNNGRPCGRNLGSQCGVINLGGPVPRSPLERLQINY